MICVAGLVRVHARAHPPHETTPEPFANVPTAIADQSSQLAIWVRNVDVHRPLLSSVAASCRNLEGALLPGLEAVDLLLPASAVKGEGWRPSRSRRLLGSWSLCCTTIARRTVEPPLTVATTRVAGGGRGRRARAAAARRPSVAAPRAARQPGSSVRSRVHVSRFRREQDRNAPESTADTPHHDVRHDV